MDIHELYQSKLKSPEGVAALVENGMHIDCDIALSAPPAILDALEERVKKHPELHGIKLNVSLDLRKYQTHSDPELASRLRCLSWFSQSGGMAAVNAGLSDVFPNYYHDSPALKRDYVDIDVFMGRVSPMDAHGYFSFGTTASCVVSGMGKANLIFLEVNPNMPRAVQGPKVHISQIDALCEDDRPLVELTPAKQNEIGKTISGHILNRIPDGATFQLGIGAIPDAVGIEMKNKKHLGIHTEMLTDSMIELIECGAVDNSLKPIDRGTTVATFALGSRKMYDYIDDNPAVAMLSADYVTDPAVIAQCPNFVSVNTAVEVDFYGQVSAESIGTRHISGTGGQTDFVRGAVMSKGGQSFIVFTSTAKDGAVSRIRPIITPGGIVTTGKNDVDMIVTEYGVAKLRGKALSERTKALIAIAHPDFRDELTSEAKKMNIII